MNRQPIAYVLFGAGAMITLGVEMLRVPAFIVALGIYLPLGRNTPALERNNISVDELLARHLLDLAGAEIEWLNQAISEFETAMRWPER